MELHLINGFLGSGKTTAIIGVVKEFIKNGKAVGIVTNDKGQFQVDAAFFESSRIPTRQVTGGCFRCSFSEFEERIAQLQESKSPDVIFAESVGSCVDLVNTVFSPIKQNSQLQVGKITFSVFADIRLFRHWVSDEFLPFSEQINYLFAKQIEEGNLLILNKADLLSVSEQQAVLESAKQRFPQKRILLQNSLDGNGLTPWMDALENYETDNEDAGFKVDYPTYKNGEQQMAWMDQTFSIQSANQDNLKPALAAFIKNILENIQQAKVPVGHLKFLISLPAETVKLSFTTADFLNGNVSPDWENALPEINSMTVSGMLNARVAIDAAEFSKMIQKAVEKTRTSTGVDFQCETGSSYNPEMSMHRP